MKEWILILTLVGDSTQSGQAIEHIPGFSVKKECEAAGFQWVTQVYRTRDTRPRAYLCVERTAARTGPSLLNQLEMTMAPHQERVVTEKRELDEKLTKLYAFFQGTIITTLDPAERERLTRQTSIMQQYSDVLAERIAAF